MFSFLLNIFLGEELPHPMVSMGFEVCVLLYIQIHKRIHMHTPTAKLCSKVLVHISSPVQMFERSSLPYPHWCMAKSVLFILAILLGMQW